MVDSPVASPVADRAMVAVDALQMARFVDALSRRNVPVHQRPYYQVWVRRWSSASSRANHALSSEEFASILEREGKSDWQSHQACQAIGLWQELTVAGDLPKPVETRDAGWNDILDGMRSHLMAKRYSPSSVKAYLEWSRRLAGFEPVPPTDSVKASRMVQDYLDHLVLVRKLSPASIAQARNALAWLVGKELGFRMVLEDRGQAHHSKRLPSVLSPETVRSILEHCREPWDLFFGLQYGCGLRLGELLDLRVRDVDPARQILTVRSGKGDKDRQLPLPRSLQTRMASHLEARRRLWAEDLAKGWAKVDLPYAMSRMLAGAETSWDWQHLFGSARPLRHPETNELRRWRPMETPVREALRDAAKKAGVQGRIHPHLLRHCYATHLIERGVPLVQVQEHMGHSRIETTMIYLHVRAPVDAQLSPLDRMDR